jgi:pyruvate dehydrogenase E2 component (dihydrolipoamide acetyltransferase)
VDVQRVTGSGPHGRVLAEDVKAAAGAGGRMTPLAQAAAQTSGQVPGAGTGLGGRVRGRDLVAPEAASAGGAAAHAEEGGPTEIPYRGIRKLIGDRMAESLASHAQLTLNSSADASALLGFRRRVKEDGDQMGLPNITLGDLVAYAVAQVLPRFPEMNAVFDFQQERILQYRQVHLAVAVDTDRGLMVPVVPHAHAKSLAELSESVLAVAAECRSGSIDPERLQGGTFTITNLGAMGIESFTPVINSPQVAILGVCTIKDEVVRTTDGETAWQPRLGLSLTIDHRAVDGAPAARFLQAVVKGIENVELLLAG